MPSLLQHSNPKLQHFFNDEIQWLIAFGGVKQSTVAEQVMQFSTGILFGKSPAPLLVVINDSLTVTIPNRDVDVCNINNRLSLDMFEKIAQAITPTTKVVAIPDLYQLIGSYTQETIRDTMRRFRDLGRSRNVVIIAGYIFDREGGMLISDHHVNVEAVVNQGHWAGCRGLGIYTDVTIGVAEREDIESGCIELVLGKCRGLDDINAERHVFLHRQQ